MCEVVYDDEVFEFYILKYSHTGSSISVCLVVDKVTVANGESVPLYFALVVQVVYRFVVRCVFGLTGIIVVVRMCRVSSQEAV